LVDLRYPHSKLIQGQDDYMPLTDITRDNDSDHTDDISKHAANPTSQDRPF
jgi:hypothetical protein